MAAGTRIKRSLIFVHRWLGIVLVLFFLLWFPSGIGIMYWDFPSVTATDRLERSPALDPATVRISPADAYASLNLDRPAGQVRLNTFDGRPVYRFGGGRGGRMVYADTGEEQTDVSREMVDRVAAAWTRQPVSTATVAEVEEIDQWTVQGGLRNLQPLWKYSWPNGEQVYVSEASGEVAQYTTTGSRLGAYVGAIPHWFYFTPLRKNGPQWSRVVIWSSGIGTISAILGIVVGLWMYSPSKRYRYTGAPTSIPYRGQKRWHTVLGLVFGLGAVTWAFSGMLSMDPFPFLDRGPAGPDTYTGRSIPQALRGSAPLEAFAAKSPQAALAQVAELSVKELELTSFADQPVYLAMLADGGTHIVPVDGPPMAGFGEQRIMDVVRSAAGPDGLAELRTLDQYDLYYLDRRRERPLPVVLARLNDADNTRYYIDPKTGRVVGDYGSSRWAGRFLYNGLHSLNFPWLYNYRPLWDIVIITFMVGGTALCVTSLILAWRVIGRRLAALLPSTGARQPRPSEDLVADGFASLSPSSAQTSPPQS